MRTQLYINSAKSLGRAIKDRRMFIGLNQAAVGKLVGLHQPQISDIERGVSKLPIDTMFKLMAALRLELLMQATRSQDIPWEEVWSDNGT